MDVQPDMIEVDISLTADHVLIVRHGDRPGHRDPGAHMTYAQLKKADPDLMTIDDLDAFIGGQVRLLLDIKGIRTAEYLAQWLARQAQPQRYAVCSQRLKDFDALLALAPAVDRWPSFPDVGGGDLRTGLRRVAAAVVQRRKAGDIAQMFRDTRRAVRDVARDRNAAISALGGLPWRDGLPALLPDVIERVQPAGISVHQWLVTPALVDAAHEMGVTVAVWTVNRPDALAAAVRAGVDYVTTDDPVAMRDALPRARRLYPSVSGPRPESPLADNGEGPELAA